MIYVIGIEGSPMVKIGLATDPAARVAGLQTGNPLLLTLLWSYEGERDLESHLHATFLPHRIRGEWFDLTSLGDPVVVVQDAVAAAEREKLLVAPRFRDTPRIATPVAPWPPHPRRESRPRQFVTRPNDAERSALPPAPPRVSTYMPKPGCIRVWDRACQRPEGTTCDC